MAAQNPVEIGTRGTVGSLIMQEIEYFSRLEIGHKDCSQKPQCKIADAISSGSHSIPKFGIMIKAQKKKKRGSRLLPSMCSIVEVADSNQPNGISGFTYRNLKADVKKLQL
ncbi:uncharacterized protein LOC117908499 [Vitis riparia]|uniref:uncharacterized protein LOC117908499 n=1 Tax=Vitis riparia TaxID=96939 RepID=UPI00155A5EE7|nr:uncharacterized protein LOC117908499 [Vitis riparia]